MCFGKPKIDPPPPNNPPLPPPTPEKVADGIKDDTAAKDKLSIRKGRSSLVIPRTSSLGNTSGKTGLAV